MKRISVLIAILLAGVLSSQINVINTGTSDNLLSISIIKNNILIAGRHSYLAKSYNECNTLSPLNLPFGPNYSFVIERKDTNVFYVLATAPGYDSKIWRSNNGGLSWLKKFDTVTWFIEPGLISFFDSLNGVIICLNNKTILTNSSMNTWTVGSWPDIYPSCWAKSYGDSTVMFGAGTNYGSIYISKDRGNNWLGVGPQEGMYPPIDLTFFNKDTLLGVTNPVGWGYNYFMNSFDGGINWSQKKISDNLYGTQPAETFSKIGAKKGSEVYILARNGLSAGGYYTGYGVIFKTTDLGQTWSKFITPFKEDLTDIKFLNDSIALVCGSNGLLFKWNTKTTVFVGVKENKLNELPVNLYPNPIIDKLHFKVDYSVNSVQVTVSNILGEIINRSTYTNSKGEIEFKTMPSGFYFVNLISENRQKVIKVIKE